MGVESPISSCEREVHDEVAYRRPDVLDALLIPLHSFVRDVSDVFAIAVQLAWARSDFGCFSTYCSIES